MALQFLKQLLCLADPYLLLVSWVSPLTSVSSCSSVTLIWIGAALDAHHGYLLYSAWGAIPLVPSTAYAGSYSLATPYTFRVGAIFSYHSGPIHLACLFLLASTD